MIGGRAVKWRVVGIRAATGVGRGLSAQEVFETDICDGIILPAGEIEMPPFRRIDDESMLQHDILQQFPVAERLFGKAVGPGCGRLFRKGIVRCGHEQLLACPEVDEGQVYGAASVVAGAGIGGGDEGGVMIGFIKGDSHFVWSVAVVDFEAIAHRAELLFDGQQGLCGGEAEEGGRRAVHRPVHEVVGCGIADVERYSGDEVFQVDDLLPRIIGDEPSIFPEGVNGFEMVFGVRVVLCFRDRREERGGEQHHYQ